MKRDLKNEISVLNKMVESLAEILEEKGIIANDEWEKRIEQKVNETASLLKV